MRAFLREALQLLYYAYFKPSALQTRLNANATAPQDKKDTDSWRLSFEAWRNAVARRLLLQCAPWWLLGLLPFCWLAWGTMPGWGLLIVGAVLLLAGWGTAVLDLPMGLVLPLLVGLVWGLPTLWPALQAALAPWLDRHFVALLAADLFLSAILGGGVGWIARRSPRPLTPWLGGLVIFLPLIAIFGLSAGAAGAVSDAMVNRDAILVVFIEVIFMAFGVFGGVLFSLSREDDMDILLGVLAGGAASLSAATMISGVAGGMIGSVASGMISIVFLPIAVSVAGIIAGSLAVSLASVVAGSTAFAITAVVVSAEVFGVAIGVVVGSALLTVGNVKLPLVLVLFFLFALGAALSPHRSFWFGPALAVLGAALFVELHGWPAAGLAWLAFMTGYLRLPLYPLALLAVAMAWAWSRLFGADANALLRCLPPFSDEIVWLPLFGLDRLLVAAAEENPQEGREAIARVGRSFRQAWAAQAALAQLAAGALENYRAVQHIPSAGEEFAWLPEEPDEALRGLAEVRRRVEGIARGVEAALGASSDYNRLRRLHQAQQDVEAWRGSFAALKGRHARHFAPVAESWRQLIGDEIARLFAEEEVKADIPNPYVSGIPLQADEEAMFAPRPALTRAVENALLAEHGKPTLALYGPRRMGKTTFLLHLARLLPDEVLPVFVDLQEAAQVAGPGGLYYNWAAAAWRAAGERRRLALPRPALDVFVTEPAIAWREWLDAAEAALGGRKLFFTFDEFEWLVDAAEKNPDMEGAFSVLRHLGQHRPRVYLLFAGAHRLEALAPGGRWHDYFIHVRGLEISYLAETDARRLLTNPIADFPLDYAPGAVDEIVRLTRCQPMLVQLSGSLLVDRLNSPARRRQGDWRTATLDDVAHVAAEVLSAGHSAYFANLWADAGEDGRRALGPLARAGEGLPLAALAAQSGLAADRLRDALARLQQYQLVELIEDRWRMQVELTRRAFARLARI